MKSLPIERPPMCKRPRTPSSSRAPRDPMRGLKPPSGCQQAVEDAKHGGTTAVGWTCPKFVAMTVPALDHGHARTPGIMQARRRGAGAAPTRSPRRAGEQGLPSPLSHGVRGRRRVVCRCRRAALLVSGEASECLPASGEGGLQAQPEDMLPQHLSRDGRDYVLRLRALADADHDNDHDDHNDHNHHDADDHDHDHDNRDHLGVSLPSPG